MEIDKQMKAREMNMQYIQKNEDVLREKYGEKYIAVIDQKVIDSDENEFELTERIYKKFPNKPSVISTIEDIVHITF